MFQHIRGLQKMYIANINFGDKVVWADSVSFRQTGKLFSPSFQSELSKSPAGC